MMENLFWIRNINSKALYGYSFDGYSLYFIDLYLKGRKQKTKINSSYNLFAEIFVGVSRGSILGPLFLTFTFAAVDVKCIRKARMFLLSLIAFLLAFTF